VVLARLNVRAEEPHANARLSFVKSHGTGIGALIGLCCRSHLPLGATATFSPHGGWREEAIAPSRSPCDVRRVRVTRTMQCDVAAAIQTARHTTRPTNAH
jgi:hypothetical protein